MKERPILFSGPMVRALLAGTKTQTRRVAKTEITMGHDSLLAPHRGKKHAAVYLLPKQAREAEILCPYGQPGDRLWVRETFVQGFEYDAVADRLRQYDDEGNELPMKTWYRATDSGIGWSDDDGWETKVPWKPSIHMPRAASRILLEITAVRIERLQTISENDARAEGASYHDGKGIGHSGWRHDYGAVHADARSAYARLWNDINGSGAWAANPWVWVVEFKRVEAAVQAAKGA
ncbi:hypothetical protein V8Z74_19415 [Comamonas sp. w2-DMI]|uniref:hypothetical protein n=1 Tax=Comamonas sp. w2-DMI TaxID=3126391 RepID=UPI0032E3B1EA